MDGNQKYGINDETNDNSLEESHYVNNKPDDTMDI